MNVTIINETTAPRGVWTQSGLKYVMPGTSMVTEITEHSAHRLSRISGILIDPADAAEPDALDARANVGGDIVSAGAPAKTHPLDHDGDGKPGGSPAGENATRTRGRARK